jgi:1,4-alpha-glucan branching enzyme
MTQKKCTPVKKPDTGSAAKKQEMPAGMSKAYLKSRNACKVTFKLPVSAAAEAKRVALVGDFNNWDTGAHTMKKIKNGYYAACLELEAGREYQFRYLIDDNRWENDFNADTYVRSPYGDSDNSVVVT